MKVQTFMKSVCVLLVMFVANTAFAQQYPAAGLYKLQNVFTGMYAKPSGLTAVLTPYSYADAPSFTISAVFTANKSPPPITYVIISCLNLQKSQPIRL